MVQVAAAVGSIAGNDNVCCATVVADHAVNDETCRDVAIAETKFLMPWVNRCV